MDLATRVARRFRAEVLSKQWLMGIRRTWLALMKPSIHEWDDVDQAFKNLSNFVDRLDDSIFFIRRGPLTSLENTPEGQKLRKQLKTLKEAVSQAGRTARHWRDVHEDLGRLPPGTFKPEEGAQMFDLYESNFEEATSTAVEGRPGKWSQKSLTDLMDEMLETLRTDAKRIVEYYQSGMTEEEAKQHNLDWSPMPKLDVEDPVYREFDLNGMKVVIDDRTVKAGQIPLYVRLFDEAHQRLKQKGFGKVWYGDIFVQCEKCGGENPHGAEFGVGGNYKIGPDTIQVFERPNPHIVYLVVHELGHRWWFKYMTRENRLRFEEWIESGLAPVTKYGGKHFHEAFAEVFAWYVLNMELTSQQVETFKLVTFGKRFAAERVVERYLQRPGSSSNPLHSQA